MTWEKSGKKKITAMKFFTAMKKRRLAQRASIASAPTPYQTSAYERAQLGPVEEHWSQLSAMD